MVDIKVVTQKDNVAVFDRYRNENLFYKIFSFESDNATVRQVCYEFPVPISDLKGATVNATEKASMMRRYLLQAEKDKTLVVTVLAETTKCLL